MPPKKKEEEIDLSTLPELKTLSALILIRGKKGRAQQLLQRIYKEADKTMSRVKRSEILDHAKEKGIYVDPSSLTDKQKKDPKFMESVSTELTAEVVAKSTLSLLAANTLKARIDRKANPLKEDPHRKYDLLYHFEDTPDTKVLPLPLRRNSKNSPRLPTASDMCWWWTPGSAGPVRPNCPRRTTRRKRMRR